MMAVTMLNELFPVENCSSKYGEAKSKCVTVLSGQHDSFIITLAELSHIIAKKLNSNEHVRQQ